jgi:hypothetical protein
MSRRLRFFRVAPLAAVLAAAPIMAHAQAGSGSLSASERRGAGDTSIFAPLGLQPGNLYRSGSGAPGPRYWQQRADYVLRGTLDTAAKSLKGEETIRYVNNSPDTLHFIWLQVEQNAFRQGSLNSYVFPAASRFGALNFQGGDVIDHIDQVMGTARKALTSRVDGTVMKVDLSRPLAPGANTTLSIGWHFDIPEHGADRMGREGALYELAQWYPRVCVYDDIRGSARRQHHRPCSRRHGCAVGRYRRRMPRREQAREHRIRHRQVQPGRARAHSRQLARPGEGPADNHRRVEEHGDLR